MTDTKHTPTPWKVNSAGQGVSHDSETVIFNPYFSRGTDHAKEDAAFIVRAVNNFDMLIGALVEVEKYWTVCKVKAPGGLVNQVRAALAKAIDQEKGESR